MQEQHQGGVGGVGGQPGTLPPQMVLMRMATGSWATCCLTAFAKLSIADHLKDDTKTLSQLVEATRCNQDFLFRFLRAATSLGLVQQDSFSHDSNESASFKLTDLGQLVRTDHPTSMRNVVLLAGNRELQLPWLDLAHAVENGTQTFSKNFGQDFWTYTSEEHPEWMKIFNGAMSDVSKARNIHLVEAYDFTGINKLVDVGGGHGALLASVLSKYPSMQGVVFDRPSVVAAEAEYRKPDDVGNRLSFVGGDFFESVPQGGDAYLLSAVIHDWGDDDSEKILKNVHKAMVPGGRLLLTELVVPNDNSPHQSKFSDLTMMVLLNGGRERTEQEWVRLYERSGFKLTRLIPTKIEHFIIEGIRV